MNILTVNCGSSSLKLGFFDVDGEGATPLAAGAVEEIGPGAAVVFQAPGKERLHQRSAIADWRAALGCLLGFLASNQMPAIDAVGHRVVHGGSLTRPAVIDEAVTAAIADARRFAPLHNGPSLEGILAARQALPGVSMVAVFDTAFHASMPPVASRYAVPSEIDAGGVRRHGFHGIAHRSMSERYVERMAIPPEDVSIITLQLGNGCSAAAVRGRSSVDTSMGFTPLEGLVMGTRCGDLDPAVVTYLQRERGMSASDIDRLLNERSGLLGLSGTSGDMAALLHAEGEGDADAGAAVDLFCYRARKYIGAYMAVLGRVQAVVFGGGIGERAPDVRRRICEPLAPLGVTIDIKRNAALVGEEGCFSRPDSPIAALVIPSDEERVIAADTWALLAR